MHLKKKILGITLVSFKILSDHHLHPFVWMWEVSQKIFHRFSLLTYYYSVPPTIHLPLHEVRAEIGDQTQLTCEVYGSPKPHIMYDQTIFLFYSISRRKFLLFSWYHNNTERQFPSDDRSILILSNVQEHHVGIYTCFASNLFGNISANIHLIVTSMFLQKNIFQRQ